MRTDIFYGYLGQQSALQNHQGLANAQQSAMQSMPYGLNNDELRNTTRCAPTPQPVGWAGDPKHKPKGKGVFSQISGDIKAFVIEHRAVIYFVAAAIIIDHFLFKGAFRQRLQDVADKLVKRVEDKVAEVAK